MATPTGSDSDFLNEVCDIINCVTVYYKKDARAGMSSFGKKILSVDVKESEDAKSFERDCQVCFMRYL